MPPGTIARDADTGEVIGELVESGETLCVARGGYHGLGNTRYKSSTNRAPRKTTTGTAGEERDLHLELKILADIGLLGLPNAGKSTLIRAISSARPRVADYPFTTLYPNLGVVRVDVNRSFVVADIPGLIEGAADGAGLGIRFLRHLSRTRLLLHLVDIMPYDGSSPVDAVHSIETELQRYDADLARQERWLVLNKTDLLPPDECDRLCAEIIDGLHWQGPVFRISALSGQGTQALVWAIMEFLQSGHAEAG